MTKTDSMVKTMADKFQEKGFEILYARCDGYPDPTEIRGVEPDVVGWDSHKELYHLGLVADSKDLSSELTKKKLTILADNMMGVGNSEGERLPLYLGTPKESTKEVENKLQEFESSTKENIIKLEV